MSAAIELTFSFYGNDADKHQVDLYDVSVALRGFQRTLALTTHLILNGEIIVHAPALHGAQIMALPAEEGSWQIRAGVILVAGSTALYQLGTAPPNTLIGHLVWSAYDYVLSETLGINADYDKTIGTLIKESKARNKDIPDLKQHQLDSLAEKCEGAVIEMHRPISGAFHTATNASLVGTVNNQEQPFNAELDFESYEYVRETLVGQQPRVYIGRISSYNSNTFKGRIFINALGRPISFELIEGAREDSSVGIVIISLAASAQRDYLNDDCTVYCRAFELTSKHGKLKGLRIVEVSNDVLR